MAPTTRSRILDHLRKQQVASVGELSQSLGMTGANIRHHLSILGSNDLIEVIGLRREGRGRPVNLYSLSRRVLGDGLDSLTRAMLVGWYDTAPENRKAEMMQSLARQLIPVEGRRSSVPLTQRLTDSVDRLNQFHYQARWEAGAAGPRILFGHCPYAAVVQSHPELCEMDVLLLKNQIGLNVQQTAKLQKSSKGLPFCAFLVLSGRVESKD